MDFSYRDVGRAAQAAKPTAILAFACENSSNAKLFRCRLKPGFGRNATRHNRIVRNRLPHIMEPDIIAGNQCLRTRGEPMALDEIFEPIRIGVIQILDQLAGADRRTHDE
jgi:hypothetical protein